MIESSIKIRRGTIADATLLAELGERTYYATFAAENTAEDMAIYLDSSFSPEIQAKELADPSAVFFIAEIDGKVTGYVKLQRSTVPECVSSQSASEIVRLYVEEAYHGRGVGAALMRECFVAAKRLGMESLWLGVWEHNYRAQAFYRKWGFQEVGSHDFVMGRDVQRDLLLECVI